MAEGEHVDENQNSHVSVFHRLASFPLVQSAYQIASFAYRDVKNVHPAVGYLCEVSERGVKAASDMAVLGVSPILKVMEPQVAALNDIALRWVDEFETKLPVLDQPADEVLSEFQEKLVSGVRVVKERALDRVQNVLDRTQTVARESYEVLSIAATFIGTLDIQDVVKVAAYFVVTQVEDLVDRYLPEESDIGPESSSSSSSDGVDEMDGSKFGLIPRSRELVRSIITRSWRRLRPILGRYWNFLQRRVSLLLTIPSQVRQCVQAVLLLVLPRNTSTVEAGPKSTVRKKKAKAPPKQNRSQGKMNSNLPEGLIFRVSPNGRHLTPDTSGGRVQPRERRRQSFDSSFYHTQIQEDVVNNVFFP